MNYLTVDDLENLIRLVSDNNQYNDDAKEKEFWDDILIRIILANTQVRESLRCG